jgi:hypothetical protein
VRLAAAIAVVLGVTATAGAESTFQLPAGYVEQPGVADAALGDSLSRKGVTVNADATAFVSPDRNVVLLRMRWTSWLGEQLSRTALEQVDRELEAGMNEAMLAGVEHISASRRFVDDQLVAESVDELDGAGFRSRRVYGVDAFGFAHMFALVCAGPKDELGYCVTAMRTMRLTVPNQVSLLALANTRPRKPNAWSFANIVGTAVLLALIIGLASWIYASANRRKRRRRRRH